ncbi:SPARC-related modular calcium-binding protein 1-like [Physeter macrocephalus]|uniref:SPARC-related modular calcium-binding protein 1-like n=1 Tax=Physeter macrocephalus TaxID=9755 RepID=A0A455AXD8_PHYMC|nr:SPARC-related modular calcium-binding protein 1-like [Physeter catodon]
MTVTLRHERKLLEVVVREKSCFLLQPSPKEGWAGGSCRILSGVPGDGGVCPWPRFSEPDPSHTLEERVVHWYFSQLDSNSSDDINKREMKPFKRYVKKKAKPKKCARRFTDYCDLNKDKVISLPELKGCLGVSKEVGRLI